VARHIFQACPVWIHTQSNITNITLCKLKSFPDHGGNRTRDLWVYQYDWATEQCSTNWAIRGQVGSSWWSGKLFNLPGVNTHSE
jgi:hypothetical protein